MGIKIIMNQSIVHKSKLKPFLISIFSITTKNYRIKSKLCPEEYFLVWKEWKTSERKNKINYKNPGDHGIRANTTQQQQKKKVLPVHRLAWMTEEKRGNRIRINYNNSNGSNSTESQQIKTAKSMSVDWPDWLTHVFCWQQSRWQQDEKRIEDDALEKNRNHWKRVKIW